MGRIGYLIDDRVGARRSAGIGERDPAESRWLAQLLFARVGVGSGYRSLLDTLPTGVLVQLATKLCVAGFRADENQWKTSGEAPKRPFVLEPVPYTALTVLVAVPYLVGTVRATGTAFGWWPWGAAWFGRVRRSWSREPCSASSFGGAGNALVTKSWSSPCRRSPSPSCRCPVS
jgi:hypothetical protein